MIVGILLGAYLMGAYVIGFSFFRGDKPGVGSMAMIALSPITVPAWLCLVLFLALVPYSTR